jgi:glutathione synthase/RimK-type ligase-like ATP-grasp enzyme
VRNVVHVTSSWDTTTDLVLRELAELGVQSIRLNTELFPMHSTLAVEVDEALIGSLTTDSGRTIVPDDVRSIYYRRPQPSDYRGLPGFSEESRKFAAKESWAALLGFLRATRATWVNHPDANRAAESKLPQLSLARELGLRIPRTMITNNPKTARAFIEALDGHAIAKTVYSPRISESRSELAYAHLLEPSDLESLGELETAPCILQEYVEKAAEYRVVVVGDTVLAVEIHSQAHPDARVDWRQADYTQLEHTATVLPEQVATACIAFTRISRLESASFDLIRGPDGAYVFLECNPSGEWGWLEAATGLPIARAFARRLSGGD